MNSLTEQLRLLEKMYITEFSFFARTLQPHVDYYQVAFQEGKRPLGIVGLRPQSGRQVKVRQGDVVIRVFCKPCEYTLTGTIATKDHYRRVYEAQLQLKVSNPERVATMYQQGSDPARQTSEGQFVHNNKPEDLQATLQEQR